MISKLAKCKWELPRKNSIGTLMSIIRKLPEIAQFYVHRWVLFFRTNPSVFSAIPMETRQVSSMIHSARPTVSPEVNIVFIWNLFCFVILWKIRTDICENNEHYCGSAEWIKKFAKENQSWSIRETLHVFHWSILHLWEKIAFFRHTRRLFGSLQFWEESCKKTAWPNL